jgi:DNA invertase Pin-like site-specific DNA recombinase
MLYRQAALVVEPSAALGVAAILKSPCVAAVICGSNVLSDSSNSWMQGLVQGTQPEALSPMPCEIEKIRTNKLTLIHQGIFCANYMLISGGKMPIYGYARVSTDGQTLAAQDARLHEAGCVKVYAEKVSGASASNRPALAKALRALAEGDTLMVTRLDRLARSTKDLLNVLDTITGAGAGFKSLADAWADTTTPHGRLMLTVLGGLAEFERELIRSRTGEGRKRAMAAGIRFGRPPKLTRHQQREALARREQGETLTDIARTYGVSHTTISRLRSVPPNRLAD